MSNDILKVGGKGAGLINLQDKGFKVPPFVILETEIFNLFFNSLKDEVAQILDSINFKKVQDIDAKSEEIKNKVILAPISKELKSKIKNIIKQNSKVNLSKDHFSVRSSATDEDGDEFSFAGQMDSFLYVKGENGVIACIKKCYASAFSARALSYRHQNSLDLKNIQLAVVIQKMIFGEVSGVLFTGNPITSKPDEMIISATWGIGEGVVSGKLNCDNWTISAPFEVLKTEIVKKDQMITFDKKKGENSRESKVPLNKQEIPCLNDTRIQELFELGTKIEKSFGGTPQDIEWAYDKKDCYLLQTRPITTLKGVNKYFEKTIWDNSNIVESYGGVTSPLTFSFASYTYDMVYRQFYSLLGTSDKKIDSMSSVFGTLLGLIRGRIYYNLTNWYKTIKLLPGYNFNRQFMESMMGVKDTGDAKEEQPQASFLNRYFVELPQLFKVLYLSMVQYFKLDKSIKFFFSNLDYTFKEATKVKFSALSEVELVEKYRFLEANLLKNWKTPIVNDFLTMIFYGILKKLITSWKIDESGSLQNDLLCAQGDIESTMPTRKLIELSNWIRDQKEFLALIQGADEDELKKVLITDSPEGKYQQLSQKIVDYIDRWGFRCVNELKLEEDSLKERPQFVFAMLKNYLSRDRIDLSSMDSKEKKIHRNAVKTALRKIPKDRMLLFLSKNKFFFWVVKETRRAVKNREELRFARTKVFGTCRQIFNAIGDHFAANGLILESKDIYYLIVPEIIALVEGRSVNENIKELVKLRRAEFDKFKSEDDPPERFFTYGPYYRSEQIVPTLPDPFEGMDFEPDMYKGVPCCPGKLIHECKVVLGPNDDCHLNGEILVTKRTDPGWVPVFPSISGLLIERGSILSHSAVVAREMGIPTIVGITNIASILNSGDVVAMDGAKGLVHAKGDMKKIDKT